MMFAIVYYNNITIFVESKRHDITTLLKLMKMMVSEVQLMKDIQLSCIIT